MRQIGEAVGLASTSAVSYQLRRLEEMGVVGKDPRRPRAYCVLIAESAHVEAREPAAQCAEPPCSVTVPVLGRIAAGAPITAEEHVTDVLTLPLQVVGSGDLFVLTVTGDSMAGNGSTLDGDLVVARRQPDAENGDVVASLGQECGATRSRQDRCSSAAMRTTIARATGVVLSLDRANRRRYARGGRPGSRRDS